MLNTPILSLLVVCVFVCGVHDATASAPTTTIDDPKLDVKLCPSEHLLDDLARHIRDSLPGLSQFGPMVPETSPSEDGCTSCVRNISRGIMTLAERKVGALCDATKCPVVKCLCARARAHPGVALGFLIERLHPGMLAYAACAGASKCKSPFNETSALASLDTTTTTTSNISMSDVLMSGGFGTSGTLSDIFRNGLLHPRAAMHMSLASSQSMDLGGMHIAECFGGDDHQHQHHHAHSLPLFFNYQLAHGHHGHEHHHHHHHHHPHGHHGHEHHGHHGQEPKVFTAECVKCVEVHSAKVMLVVYEMFRDFCKLHTDLRCPAMRWICHKIVAELPDEVLLGYLLAVVEPWKYGLGYCFGQGSCRVQHAQQSPMMHLPLVNGGPYGGGAAVTMADVVAGIATNGVAGIATNGVAGIATNGVAGIAANGVAPGNVGGGVAFLPPQVVYY